MNVRPEPDRDLPATHPAVRAAEARIFPTTAHDADPDDGSGALDDTDVARRYATFRASELHHGEPLATVIHVTPTDADRTPIVQHVAGAPQPLGLLLALMGAVKGHIDPGDRVETIHVDAGGREHPIAAAAWPPSWPEVVALCATGHDDADPHDEDVAAAGDTLAAVASDPTVPPGDAAAVVDAVRHELARRGVTDPDDTDRVVGHITEAALAGADGYVGGALADDDDPLGTSVTVDPADGAAWTRAFRMPPTRYDVYQLLVDELGAAPATVTVVHVSPRGQLEYYETWPTRYRHTALGL